MDKKKKVKNVGQVNEVKNAYPVPRKAFNEALYRMAMTMTIEEIDDSKTMIITELTPGIDRKEWTEICQTLGAMDRALFSCVRERIQEIVAGYQEGLQEACV